MRRLRFLLSLLTESATRRLSCSRCHGPLAAKRAVFTLPGADGTVGAYVNPHGFIHQTLTLRTLVRDARVVLDGQPESRDSWFAGYAWQIAYCAVCGLHLGWRFSLQQHEQQEEEQEQQQQQQGQQEEEQEQQGEPSEDYVVLEERPPFFWGLRRAALEDEYPQREEDDLEEEEDDEGEQEGSSSDIESESSENEAAEESGG